MKKVSYVQSVVSEVRFTTVANIVHKVASKRNVCTSGPSLSCKKASTFAPGLLLQGALVFGSSSLHHG